MNQIPYLILISLILVLGGCESSPEEICQKEVPEFRVEMARAWVELGSQVQRSLASEAVTFSEVTEDEREKWAKWGLKRLLTTQSILDAMKVKWPRNAMNAELSEVANEWVRFYGYAQSGDRKHMSASLAKAATQGERVIAAFCSSPPPSSE